MSDFTLSRLTVPGDNFAALTRAIPFEQRSVRVFGRVYPQPRLTRWYGPVPYTYSGLTSAAAPLPALLDAIRRSVEVATGASFNAVMCNLYRDGSDTVGWHADDEPLFGPAPAVASLSFGAARSFDVRHKVTGERQRFELGDGALLFMATGAQSRWQHRVPRQRAAVGPRINLTFRLVPGR